MRSRESPIKEIKESAVFFSSDLYRQSGDVRSMKDKSGSIFDVPIDDLTLLKVHGFGDRSGKIDIPLVGSLSA